jgi:hypothetical protein
LTKRRVYELAKDYGMKGPEMAKLLRDLGFEAVKTHMAVLDEPLQMQIQGRLEAAGVPLAGPTATAEEAPPRREVEQVVEPSLLKPLKKKLPTPVPTPQTPKEIAPPVHHAAPPPARPAPEPVLPQVIEPLAPAAEQRVETTVAEESIAPEAGQVEPSVVGVEEVALEHVRREVSVEARDIAAQEPAAESAEPSAGTVEAPADAREVKKLRLPEPRAKVLGRIELSSETIRDAGQRSAPAGERNPA